MPRDVMVVVTGLSGSGKSSLAFDTIYAEGQRRYVESLSAYARQFLGQMDKPDVDHIDGLSPAVSIDQKTTSNNPRSTVATVTEIYDYLRLLYARAGRAREEGRVRKALQGSRRRRLRAGAGRRGAARVTGGLEPRQELQTRYRGRGGPARDPGGYRAPAHRLGRDGLEAGRGSGAGRGGRGGWR